MPEYDVAIVGGGISGLSALHFITARKPELRVHLFEADDRLGGTIGTDHIDGFSFDWGPNGFLDREPITLQLCAELGLGDRLERANENVSKRFILRDGKLQEVPMSPGAFLTSPILSLPGRLRVLYEPFARGPKEGVDESIYDFVARRIGREAADYLVQPMVSGIYGGLADRLSLKSCFKIMHEMESEYGSLFKAMIAKARAAKKSGKKAGGPAGPGGWLTSFHGGLYGLVERFGELYGQQVTGGKEVSTVAKGEGGYRLSFVDGSSVTASRVVLAVPSYKAAEMVTELSGELSQAFSDIRYAPIAVICLGYRRTQVRHPLDGFGFLVPQKEKRTILGSIWTSSIFAARAPEAQVQLRTMIGGDGDHESIELTDEELLRVTSADLDGVVGLNGEPTAIKIYRWKQGIPQFAIGHGDVMRRIEAELNTIGDLYITGNAYYGIGLNDCVKQSFKVAESI